MSENIGKSIAIVGRPNVGKSRLFNRILKKRVSIVHDRPGVTRDIVAEKLPNEVILMDTGGLGATQETTEKVIADATDTQVFFAVDAADMIFFVVDSQEGLTSADNHIAEILRKYDTPVCLIVNKTDLDSHKDRNSDFYDLGFKNTLEVSAEHGLGMEELFALIEDNFGSLEIDEDAQSPEEERIKICVAGRPNVGKSSIGNKLLGSQRLIVSDVAGTTRDSVKCDIDYVTGRGKEIKYRFFDTAGLRAKRKINTSLDYLSTIRTKSAIESCDVVFLVIDALNGVSELDKKLAGEILASGASIMIVVNKWDLAVDLFRKEVLQGYESLRDFKKKFEEAVREELFFLEDAPMAFLSALKDKSLDTILDSAYTMYKRTYKDLPTGKLNSTVRELIDNVAPKIVDKKRFKVYYCLQTAKRPITIRMYCNSKQRLDGTYQKYMEKNLRKVFTLGGVSLKLDFVGKPKQTLQTRLATKPTEKSGDKKEGATFKRPSLSKRELKDKNRFNKYKRREQNKYTDKKPKKNLAKSNRQKSEKE